MSILEGLDPQADAIETELQQAISLVLGQAARIALDSRLIEFGQIETGSNGGEQPAQFRKVQLGRCASSQEQGRDAAPRPQRGADFALQGVQVASLQSRLQRVGYKITVRALPQTERDMHIDAQVVQRTVPDGKACCPSNDLDLPGGL